MKRGIGLFLLLLVLLGGAVPWLIGLRLQQGYEHLLDTLRRNGLQATALSYRPAWLASEAVTELSLPGIASSGPHWRAESRLTHVSPGRDSRFAVVRTRMTPTGGGPAIVIDTDLFLDDGSRSNLVMAASGQSIGSIRYRPQEQRLEASLRMAELSIPAGEAGQYSLYGLDFSADSYLGAAGLRLGGMELRLDGMDFLAVDGGMRRQLRGLHLNSGASAAEGRVLVTNQWRIGALGLGDYTLNRLEASLRLQGLSAVLLARTARVVPLFFLERPPPGAPAMALAGTLLSNFTRLLQSEPRLDLEYLRFSTADGDFDAALHWRLRPPQSTRALDPDNWWRRLELEGRLEIAESLARRLMASLGDESEETGWLDDLLREGLLLHRHDRFYSKLRMQHGRLSVNGVEVTALVP